MDAHLQITMMCSGVVQGQMIMEFMFEITGETVYVRKVTFPNKGIFTMFTL